MDQVKRLRPSPAMVVAFLSLTVAVSGVAWAAATIGPGDIKRNAVRKKHIKKNQVRAKHIKRNQVRAKHIKRNQVKTRHLKGNAVTTDKIADNAVTGAKADESTFGTVPSANSANNVSGVTLRPVAFRGDIGDSETILDVGGFELLAQCNAGPALEVQAQTDAGVFGVVRSYGIFGNAGGVTNYINAFLNPGPPPIPVNILPLDQDDVVGTTVMANLERIVTVDWMNDENPSAAETDCTFVGTATQH